MDETYIRVRGKWMYLYRAVDKAGNALDFMLPKRRNRPAAAKFFAKALSSNGIPSKKAIPQHYDIWLWAISRYLSMSVSGKS